MASKKILPNPAFEPADLVTEEYISEVLAPAPDSSAAAGGEPTTRVSAWFMVVYAFTNFSMCLGIFMPSLFSLAYKAQLLWPDTKAEVLSVVVGVSAIFGLVLGPIVGVMSDRTRLRWGRRRPYLVAGVLLSGVGSLIIFVADSVPVMVVGACLGTVAICLVGTAVGVVIAENVPEVQRGKIGALAGVSGQLAGVGAFLGGSMLTGNLLLLFLAPTIVIAMASVLFLFTVPDRPADLEKSTAHPGIIGVLRDLVFDPRKHRDFSLVWLGKFLLTIGIQFYATYQFFFLLDRLGLTPEDAGAKMALLGGLSLLVTMGGAIGSGFLSDRLHRRKPFIYAAVILVAGGLLLMAFSTSFEVFAAAGLVLTLGIGIFSTVDVALAGDLLPDKENGASRWMSIYWISANLPTAIAPVVAPAILLIGSTKADNYTVLYIFAALAALGALISTKAVRSVR
ncbi:MFS transporter [Pseudarthrobacter sp. NPDC058329]|uniref:MFS transporter n=1 Tax=Pseudarthrobacter sp. NPDC058329 TaxID=3346448 RepID=UPI0036DBE34C